MNREMEFKAYVKPLHEMAEVITIDTKRGEAYIKTFNKIQERLGWYKFDQLELLQFTGLYANKNKLFEGDIFRYKAHPKYLLKDFTGAVEYRDGGFGYVNMSVDSLMGGDGSFFTSFSEHDELESDLLNHIEIVGSVHLTQTA